MPVAQLNADRLSDARVLVLANVERPIRVIIGHRAAIVGILMRIEPQATNQVTHPALLSTAGGPLIGAQDESTEEADQIVLAEPRFKAVIQLSPESSKELGCGERGYATWSGSRRSVGEHLVLSFHDWFEKKWEAAQK